VAWHMEGTGWSVLPSLRKYPPVTLCKQHPPGAGGKGARGSSVYGWVRRWPVMVLGAWHLLGWDGLQKPLGTLCVLILPKL
jgi:hypothetical protein